MVLVYYCIIVRMYSIDDIVVLLIEGRYLYFRG